MGTRVRTNERLSLQGVFTASLWRPGKRELVIQKVSRNLITNLGKNLVARHLLDVPGWTTGITYQAVGDGTDAVTVQDIKLDDERIRKRITSRSDTASAVAAYFTFFAGPTVSFQIEELGVFGHSTAVDTVDSGVLFARSLLSLDNTAGNDLTVSYVLTVT